MLTTHMIIIAHFSWLSDFVRKKSLECKKPFNCSSPISHCFFFFFFFWKKKSLLSSQE